MKTRTLRRRVLILLVLAGVLVAAGEFVFAAGRQAPAADIRVAVVLGNGNKAVDEPTPLQTARCLEAFDLYKSGAVNKFVVTGGFTFDYISEARMMKIALVTWGVVPDDVVEDEMAASTIENGLFSSRIFEQRAWPKTARLVTQKFHMERSVGIYKANGFQVQEAISPDASSWPDDFGQVPDLKAETLPKVQAAGTLVVYEPFSSLEPMPWPTAALAHRLRVAAALYHSKAVPAIVLYNDPYTRGPYTPAQMMKVALVSLGVAPPDVRVVGRREYRRLAELASSLGDKPVTVMAPGTAKALLAQEPTAKWRTIFVD